VVPRTLPRIRRRRLLPFRLVIPLRASHTAHGCTLGTGSDTREDAGWANIGWTRQWQLCKDKGARLLLRRLADGHPMASRALPSLLRLRDSTTYHIPRDLGTICRLACRRLGDRLISPISRYLQASETPPFTFTHAP
jgi:hypothetical protein